MLQAVTVHRSLRSECSVAVKFFTVGTCGDLLHNRIDATGAGAGVRIDQNLGFFRIDNSHSRYKVARRRLPKLVGSAASPPARHR